MYTYKNIKNVLNYVPDGLLEEESESQVIKWALQGYKSNITNVHITQDIKFCVAKIVNHKASLPDGLKKVLDIGYSTTLPTELGNSNTVYIQENFDGNRVSIFQSLVFQVVRPYINGLKYTGQNSDVVHNDCLNVNCLDCLHFSLSKDLTTATIDVKEGYLFMLYSAMVQDDEQNFLVPDHPTLMAALGMYCEAKHFQNRSFRREQGAEETYMRRMQSANLLFEEFQSKEMLGNFDPNSLIEATHDPILRPGRMFQQYRNR